MGYYIDQLAEQDRQKRLADLLAMQQDNSEPGVSYETGVPDEKQQFLRMLADPSRTLSTEGFDPLGTTGRGEPYMPPQPLPQNYIKNESTGKVTDLGPSNRTHDVYRDGPQVLKEYQNPDGTIDRFVKKPTTDGFGRQSTVVVRETVTPDYLNPAMVAKQKFERGKAELAQAEIENKIKQTALNEDASMKAGNAMTAKQYEARHGKIPSGFEIYQTETGETDIRPVQGGKQYIELQDRLNKFESSKKSVKEYEDQINTLEKHPGRESATGFSSITNPIAFSGGDAKTFLNELETFQSQAFLSNIDKLRGTGPLSNVEGEKLQAAVGNLNPTSDEATFVKNLKYVKQKFNDLKSVAEKEADQARSDLKREKPKLTSADGEAMAWAMKNPNDPRAAQIKAKLGVR